MVYYTSLIPNVPLYTHIRLVVGGGGGGDELEILHQRCPSTRNVDKGEVVDESLKVDEPVDVLNC